MNEVKMRSDRYTNKKKKHRGIKFLLFLISIITIASLYACLIGSKGLEIKEYKITNSSITNNFYGLKIIHLTDIHYGRSINEKEMKNIVDEVNLLRPDIVVLTGDLLDEDIKLNDKQTQSLIDNLKNLNPLIKKYAITGNHDKDLNKWLKIINDSNFINLNDTYDLVYKGSSTPIIISGISSSYKSGNIDNKLNNTLNYLKSLKDNDIKPIYSILLIHEPDFVDNVDISKFNLILSGHSHNGQINLPFIKDIPILKIICLPKYGRKYYAPYYKIDNTEMYISSGLGTSFINARLFDKPSFNFYRLTNK